MRGSRATRQCRTNKKTEYFTVAMQHDVLAVELPVGHSGSLHHQISILPDLVSEVKSLFLDLFHALAAASLVLYSLHAM